MHTSDYECIRSLIIRSPQGSSPIDFNVQVNIEAKDYDKCQLKLLSIAFEEDEDGDFPANATQKSKVYCVEANFGQMVFDTNNKRTFLGSTTVTRDIKPASDNRTIENPIIELASIPNGNVNFSLRDIYGALPVITNVMGVTSLKSVMYVFQVYLYRSDIKNRQMNI